MDRLGAMRPEADRVLQELVDDAREVFGTGFCMVNLVTADTQFFKVWSGELPPEVAAAGRTPRERSMCRHVVEDEQPFVVEDFLTTERFREQHLRMGPGVRFYAGVPLKTSEGHAIGALCLVDSRPREFDDRDTATLRAFARAAVGRLEVLGAAARERDARESERQYRRNVFELANDAILIYSTETGFILDANHRACEMYGLPQETLVGRDIAELSLERGAEEEHTREVLRRRSHRGFETAHRRADGTRMHVSINSSVTEYAGQRAILSIVRDVTERKRTEESLCLSEQRHRLVARATSEVIWDNDLATGRQVWDGAINAMFGYSSEDLGDEGRWWQERVHPDDRPRVLSGLEALLEGEGEVWTEEYRFRCRDGTYATVVDRCYVVRDGGNRPVRMLGSMMDISERKRTEEALRESERRHRRQARELGLLHQVRTALAQDLEPPAVFRAVVEAIARTYGYTQVSAYRLQGETLELQHQVGYERVLGRIPIARGVMGRVVRTRQPVLIGDVRSDPAFLGAIEGITSEICVPLIDEGEVVGTLNVESTSGVELTGDDLRVMAALAEHVNVALRRAKLLARVRESEERFRSLIQNASDVITLLEVDGTILYESLSVERTLGYRPEELIGRNAFDYVHPDDLDRTLGAFSGMLTDPGLRPSVEYRFRCKDGSWCYLESIGSNLLDDPRVEELVVNSRDVTERKRWEEKLRGPRRGTVAWSRRSRLSPTWASSTRSAPRST